ncbi:MAG: ATP synthase F1 subunit delta [Bacteroidetes bacterium]|nr:ATP synthase F1 subunit delta [Bacteroidota bacterium]
MNEIKIADRYARALFDLALEKNILEKIYSDVLTVAEICRTNKDFILFLKTPVIKESKKVSVIQAIFENKLQEVMLAFLAIITRNRRESQIPVIARQFIEIYKSHKNIITAELTTAATLPEDLRKKIISIIKNATQCEVDLQQKTDESIIGGFVLSFKDKQYDASILRQIQNLRQEFNINLYIKGY